MLKFIAKLGLFVSTSVIVWIGLIYISQYINQRYLEAEYQGIETLILGDSHTKYLNEVILPNSENLSYEGDSYKEVYYKLKYFTKFNDIQNVILGVSYHNFTHLAEQKIVNDYHSINRIAPIVSIAELYSSTQNSKEFINVAVKAHFPSMVTAWSQKIWGGNAQYRASVIDKDISYRPMDEMKKSPKRKVTCKKFVKKRIEKHYRYQDIEDYHSHSSESYFASIVQHCQVNNINLLAVNMPLHPCYRNKVPKYYIQNLSRMKRKYLHLSEVTYIDYASKYDDNKEYFRDPDHTTEYGSHLITQELKRYLR